MPMASLPSVNRTKRPALPGLLPTCPECQPSPITETGASTSVLLVADQHPAASAAVVVEGDVFRYVAGGKGMV